ncbi:DegT/DnrJ/EryC1/StrS family aminotransferase [Desulfovibrio sp. OttesenSCG-928-O18]|nr:DegT/DnrJ/EryC1/StrS family aminotransferase [Desulfovibrio sp. OttesenSCG-928-O18]
MQFIDLAAQQKRIRAQIDARIAAVLDHGAYIMGPEVKELETALGRYCGAKHCVSCASGTDALLMVLMAWGVGPGDAVFVPSFTFFATGEVVSMLGATPVMVDIEPTTFNMDPAKLEKAVAAVLAQDAAAYPLPAPAREKRLTPRAVIPVDLFGQAADYDALLAVAAKHGLLVMEDAAQAFGAEYRGRKTCGLGCHAATTSFFPAKPLGCYGDGGAIFTDDDALADLLRSIRVHGKGSDKYDNVRIGVNGRIDTIQAAVLLPKFEIFPEEIQARQRVAGWYARELGSSAGVIVPEVLSGNLSVWAQYCVRFADRKRDAVAAYLKEKGIPTNIYYPTPMHMLGVFAEFAYSPHDMPVSLAVSGDILALPFHPYLAEEDVKQVAATVKEALAL